MEKIVRKNGYVYLVEGEKGFETFYNLGKDIDDPKWGEEAKEIKKKYEKKKKKKEVED